MVFFEGNSGILNISLNKKIYHSSKIITNMSKTTKNGFMKLWYDHRLIYKIISFCWVLFSATMPIKSEIRYNSIDVIRNSVTFHAIQKRYGY